MNKIINFKKKYINQIVDLFLEVFEKEPWKDNWPTKDKAKKYLNDIVNTPGFKGYLYYKDDKIIGVLLGNVVSWWEGDEFFVKEFFIKNEYQNKGIGSQMMDYINEELLKENINTCILLTESHAPAAIFYKKRGFKISPYTVFMYKNIKQ